MIKFLARILYGVFKPKEVGVLLDALDQLDPLFSNELFYKQIKEQVQVGYNDPKMKANVLKSMYEMKLSPSQIALYGIAANCSRWLSIGKFHVHHGVVGIEGESMKNIFRIAVKELEKTKYFTPQQAKEEILNLEHAISQVG